MSKILIAAGVAAAVLAPTAASPLWDYVHNDDGCFSFFNTGTVLSSGPNATSECCRPRPGSGVVRGRTLTLPPRLSPRFPQPAGRASKYAGRSRASRADRPAHSQH